VFIGSHSTLTKFFGTLWDSQTPEILTPDSGVGVGIDFFSGVGSGLGLPQMITFIQAMSRQSEQS
jgi:hypothetical protein